MLTEEEKAEIKDDPSRYDWIEEVPEGLNNYEKAKYVLEHGVRKVNGVILDAYTASAVTQVYEALTKDETKEKFNKINFFVLVDKVWKLVAKHR